MDPLDERVFAMITLRTFRDERHTERVLPQVSATWIKKAMRPILRLSRLVGFATLTLLVFIVLISAKTNPPQGHLSNTLDEQARALKSPWYLTPKVNFELRAEDPDDPQVFEEFEKEVKAGRVTTLEFNNTGLDKKARATAQLLRKGQTLTVRIRARYIPDPSIFGARRYTLWVYLSNYQMRLYLGDLPLTSTSKPDREGTTRSESDSMFRHTSLPVDAVFGGLSITTETACYTPVINEPLRPLLTTLDSGPSGGKNPGEPEFKAFFNEPSTAVTSIKHGVRAPGGQREIRQRHLRTCRNRSAGVPPACVEYQAHWSQAARIPT